MEDVLKAYRKRVLYTRHVLNQMNLPERIITRSEVDETIESDEIIEDYPKDPRGHSCLLLGKTRSGRVIHAVCAPTEDCLVIVTVYAPTLLEWKQNFKRRRRGTK